MTIERYIRIFAGTVVLLSLALGVEGSPLFVNKWWLGLSAFAGLHLFQSGITNFCLPAILLRKLGIPESNGACSLK